MDYGAKSRITKPDLSVFPTSLSSLHLPSHAHNFSSTLSSLKRSTLSPQNRLRSIVHDASFVQSVASQHGLPLIANERCGSWYIPLENKAGSAYFKSTDGHWGQWAFSTRRLNLQILDIIGDSGGCVIVDSTRRGKSMPDALSKTVPIWCAVLNRLLFEQLPQAHALRTPGGTVGGSEHAQIEGLIEGFVQNAKSLQFDIAAIRAILKKPLLPSWVTPNCSDLADSIISNEYNHVICCTASRRVYGAEASEDGYIQGAADDHEAWSRGLTPAMLWKHREELLELQEQDMPDFFLSCIKAEKQATLGECNAVRLAPTDLYIGTLSDTIRAASYDATIVISSNKPCEQPAQGSQRELPRSLHLLCSPGKLGSRALRTQLPLLEPFLAPLFATSSAPKIVIACPDGKDLSVGVALAILCLFFDDQYVPKSALVATPIDKTLIRRRLAKITTAKPDVNPSRTTLQSVHSFLMPRQD